MPPDPKCSLINSEKEKKKYSSRHDIGKAFVHRDFLICSHGFVRVDRERKPLEYPYEGPFQIVERIGNWKCF